MCIKLFVLPGGIIDFFLSNLDAFYFQHHVKQKCRELTSCHILDSKHKDSGFLPGLLFVLKHFPPVPSLLRFFIKYTALCEKKFFLHLPTKSYRFIIYSLLVQTNKWTGFHALNHSGILEIKPSGFFSFCCDSFHFVAGLIRCSFIGVLVGILATNSDLLFYRLYCLTLTWESE